MYLLCYFINYISYNKVALDYKFIYFIKYWKHNWLPHLKITKGIHPQRQKKCQKWDVRCGRHIHRITYAISWNLFCCFRSHTGCVTLKYVGSHLEICTTCIRRTPVTVSRLSVSQIAKSLIIFSLKWSLASREKALNSHHCFVLKANWYSRELKELRRCTHDKILRDCARDTAVTPFLGLTEAGMTPCFKV